MMIRNKIDLCAYFGEPANASEERLSRDVYKATACGGWLKLKPDGIEIGTIVEGSDAEFCDEFKYPFSSEMYETVWSNIEYEADLAWREANEGEEDEPSA